MKTKLFAGLLLLSIQSNAQEFPGNRVFSTNGVNGVFYNPASIAGNGYRYDVNILSVHTFVGNNNADFNLRSIARTLNIDTLRKKMFSADSGPATGMVNVVFNGPSFMLRLNERSSLAFTTRARTIANIIDLDGKLADQVIDDINSSVQFPYVIASNTDMRVATNAWTEIGASYARTLLHTRQHVVKAGVSLKLLGGISNGYLNISQLHATIDQDIAGDVYMENAKGMLRTGFGGLDISNIEAGDFFNFQNTGFGADLGFVYEFRPFNNDQYKYKAGISLVDIGSIKYKRDMQKSGGYQLDIAGAERFYFNELSDSDIEDYNDVFKSRPQYFTPLNEDEESYKVSLPATLNLNFDYFIKPGFFAALSAQLPLNSDKFFNPRNYSSISLVPRYERRSLGVAIPFNYNSLTKFNAGLSFRIGPLFLGSGSVLSALVGSSKQADFHLGLRFGGLKK